MSASVFLDTNILVYAAIGTGDDDGKRKRSMQLIGFPVQPADHQLVCIAIARSQRYQISYWDAAILAAAEALGAHTVYSDELNDGQKYGNVRVVNPYVSQ